jgi:hypothetical protein
MRKDIALLGTIGLSLSILAACSSDTTEKENPKPVKVEINNEEEKGEDIQVSGENKEETETKDTEENNVEANTAAGNFKDQVDLKIGDTGQAESTIGKYEITINSVEMKDQLDGKESMFDHFFIMDITIKNLGGQPLDAIEPINTLELTEILEGSGSNDFSQNYASIKALTGKVEPGQSVNGQAVFHGRESDKYYVTTNVGLLAAGAVKNKTTWTFDKSEAQ